MGIFRFIFSCITQAIKIAIGVAITIALFFAAGYLIDIFAAKKTAPPDDPRLKPYASRGMPLTGTDKEKGKKDSLYLSFFETLLNKKPDLMPEQPLPEKKADGAAPGAPGRGNHGKEAASAPADKPGLKPSPYQPSARPAPAPVQVSSQPSQAASGEAVTYTLQLGSFQSSDVANSFTSSLTAKGYEPMIVKITVPDRGIVYRVRLGKYKNLEDAQKMASEFEKKEGIAAFITSK